jgi:EmrB/QacA subfamily drug resistance transporter
MPPAAAIQEKAYQRRWAILVVLCVSLLVIVLDNSILNVAIPTLIRELDASNSQVQWMVDSYTLVFAGLLLTMGALGDRYGRRGALQAGYLLFGIGSLASAFAGSADQLIATRAFMGIGGALIMPATLSIITNVFPPQERGRAIGVWAGTAGVGIAVGPLAGGFLLTHFYWGSIFLVNLPIVVFGLVAGFLLIPTSKDPSAPKLDPVGAALSIVSLVSIVYALIEAPTEGWASTKTLVILGFGLVVLAVFVWWERRSDHPMLDVNFFRNRRFSAANAAITLIFFAMFGSIFLLTQYMQFTLGYSPLSSGVRLLPYAVTMMIVAPASARVVEWIGSKVTVAAGLALACIALFLMAGLQVDTSYPDLAWRLVVLAAGMGLVMAPATDSVMGSLPLAKAGVGSAVNDTTRQVGGALGVAIVGSVVSSVYGTKIVDFFAGTGAPKAAVDAAKNSLGGAFAVASDPRAKQFASSLRSAANSAFVDAFHWGAIVGGLVLIVAFVIVVLFLPARATEGMAPDAIPPGDAPDRASADRDETPVAVPAGDGAATPVGDGTPAPVPTGGVVAESDSSEGALR